MSNASDRNLQGLLESLSADALQALLEEASPREESAPGPPAGRSGEPDEAVPMSGVMPATQMQVLFWRIYAADPDACENHQSLSFHISGALDAEALAAAFQAVSASQPSLRTVFFETDGDVFQRIEPLLPIPFEWIGPEAAPGGASAERADMDAFIRRPFRLGEEPPIRVRLTSRRERDHLLQIVLHHIASDGRSKVVLLDGLSRSYRAMRSGEGAGDRDRYPVLADWVERERLWLPGEEAGRAAAYWREGSHGNGLEHAWPQGREWSVRGDVPSTGSGALTFGLSEELSDRFHAFAAERGMTAFQLWVGTYGLTLQRLMPGAAVTIGLPVDLRRRTEEAELVGCLMNLVPVTLEAELPETVDGYLRRVGQRVLEAMEHARLPWLRIREESLTGERVIRKAGWRTLINFKEDYAGALSIPGARVEALPFIQTGYAADLVLTLQVARGRSQADRVEWTAEPSAEALTSGDASCLLETWRSVIVQCVYRNTSRVADIDILLPGERERIRELSGIDNTRTYPDTTIHERFHQTASLHPLRPAVIRADGTETDYQELRRQARQVASFLLHRGLQREQIVAIHLHRSPELLAALLGILEAGGAFLLLEPSIPLDRLRTMADQARVAAILSDADMPVLPGFTDRTHRLPDILAEEVQDMAPPVPDARPDDLACIIFTSGSTGTPKGVMLEHRNLVNYLSHILHIYSFSFTDRTLQKTLLSFDACLIEWLLPTLSGGAVVIPEAEGMNNMHTLAAYVAQRQATYLFFAPAQLKLFLEVPGIRETNRWLKTIACGGEALPESLLNRCRSLLDARLFNIYGPTETAISVAQWPCRQDHRYAHPPIGTPNPNVDILILDAQGRPVPPGLPGELWIGGAQTGRGYIHNPEETAKRFVDDPLRPGSGRRYYRTGDLARFLPDGNLLFLGRLDDQVKVRGVRIEPGDVTAGLLHCAGVHQAVVLSEPDGEGSQRLRAWVTPQPDTILSEAAIRAELASRLPAYMVPFRIHVIDAIPLSTHGKTDHRALRALAEADEALTPEGLPLTTPTQLRLALLWSQLLRVEVRYADADFFRLGGHSLLAMQLAARLHNQYGVTFPLADFYASPRLDQLATRLDAPTAEDRYALNPRDLPPVQPGERIPMSAAQRRMWMLQHLLPHPDAYHIAHLLPLTPGRSASEVKAILRSMAQRHDILRTRLRQDDDGFWQEEIPFDDWQIDWGVLQADTPGQRDRLLAELRAQPFDLSRDNGWRARWIDGPGEPLLCLVFHHAITDEWSSLRFRNELQTLLDGNAAPQALPRPAYRYADFARWQHHALSGERRTTLENYWRARFDGMGEPVRIPADSTPPDTNPGPGARTHQDVPQHLHNRLDQYARQHGLSRFSVWMALWQILQARLGNGADVLLATPVSERDRPEWQDVLGMCLNTLPIRARIDPDDTFRTLSQRTRQAFSQDLQHALLPYEDILQAAELSLGPDSLGLPQVMLVLHGEQEWSEDDILPEQHATPIGRHAKNPLGIHITDRQGHSRITLEYDTERFHPATAEALLQRFLAVATQALQNPDIRLADIDILLPGEQERIRTLSGIDHTRPYPDTTIHERFHHTASLHPQRPAVIRADGTATDYQELRRQARQVASFLRHRGLQREQVVAIHLHRSPELLAALLGILEAGGAFLLLEPSIPLDRLRTMADQARVAAILSDADMPVLPGFTDRTHRLPGILAEDVQDMATPMPDARPDDLACVIFTSGSTGTPKGAMLEHRNLVNYLLFLQEEYRLSSDLRTLHRTPYSFDPCLYELLLPISCGGASVIAAPGMENDSTHIIDTVTSLQVTYLFFTPAQLKVFLQEQDIHRLDGTLRIIQCAGEALDETTMRICLDTLGASLSNAYGPAEAGAVTQWICHNGHEYPNPSIGRPNVHVDILILDAQGRPVPPGLPGELWIGGAQTGRGYIHNPEETAKRFVDDPLRPGSGRRYYRTGDLARFLPDGNLLFLGRLDDQVKVRGVRIEPGDVAAGLQHCKGVSQAVVLPEPDGEGSQRLRAWVTPQPDTSLSEAAIRAELAARLPAYMVPFRIHVIDAVPLTMNGKTDHRALRALAEADEGLTPEGLPLTTPTQHRLAHLWSQLLRVEVRYADADFFRLGGHSLHLMRLLQSIRHVWGVSPDLQTLLEASSLEDMAARIDAHRQPSDQHAAGVPTTLRLWEADGTGGMYFCDGGLGNNVRIVKTLATRQGWTWNTYHIPTPHLHPVGSGETSLEAITERYVETILDVHVDGPIVLVGFCLAGLEAHATACRLQQTSPHPVHLILIDTVHPDGLAMPGRIDPKDPDTDTATGDVTRHIGVRKPTMDIDALEGIGREAVARGILDPEWYLHRNPDVADAGVDPAIHYLAEGWREGRLPSPWFHADTYALLEPGFRAQHPDPVRHFLNVGMQRPSTHRGIMGMAIRWKQMEKGDVPHRIFDADWHLARYPEIADGPYPPLTHYVLHGWAEHRTPALHFDKWVYHAICRGFDPFRHNPVLHYLLIGQYDPVVEKAVRTLTSSPAEAEALVAGGWFEPEAYARRYADTRLLGRPGLDHFMSIGWRYARSPFTGYDPDAFARQFPGFIPDQQNPLRHLLELGSLPIRVGTIPETARAEASPTSDLAPSPLNSATIASNPPNASVAQEEMGPAEREFLVALGRIRKGYRPAFFSGRIYLCANQHLYNVDPLLGWTEGLHGHIQSHPLRGGHDTILGDDLEANADIFRSILEGIFASTS